MHRRELLKALAASSAALPFLTPAGLLAQTSDEALLATLHPDLRRHAAPMLARVNQMPPLSRANLPQMREGANNYARKPLAEVPVERRLVPGRSGQPDVAVHVINGGAQGRRPAILHTHGGGFVMGRAQNGIHDLQILCRQLDCVAVSVSYRLAPETTFAGSIEDNYAGLKWLYDNAEELGVDRARIAVMGESAGGGHAALLAIAARDRGEVPVAFQCLIYPMLDDRTGAPGPAGRQVPAHVGQIVWTAQANRFGWECFLGTRPGARKAPAGAVPARVRDLAGLPPAWIGVGSLDLFCDEDVDYAQRLNAVGVPAQLIVVPGGFHGFDNVWGAPISAWFNESKLAALRTGLGISAA